MSRPKRAWNAETGEELLVLEGHNGQVNGVAISPDGKRVASGAYDKLIRLWDAETGAEIRSFKGHTAPVGCGLMFTPDGARLVSKSGDGTVRIWDVSSKSGDSALSKVAASAHSVVCSNDGRHIAVIVRDAENLCKSRWRERLTLSAAASFSDTI